MQTVAILSKEERKELFLASSVKMKVNQAIIEKDFWVCWTLDQIFQVSRFSNIFAFKGGTSLSKAYNLINRFSEDIDLILDWRVLGYEKEEPWKERSNTKQEKFNKEANIRTVEFLKKKFVPAFQNQISEKLQENISIRADDEQNVYFSYPKCFEDSYILPEIRLEIGPLASWFPMEMKEIEPYAAIYYPNVFSHSTTTIPTVSAERTFWEKATILHQEAQRDIRGNPPSRHSRHYYDFYKLLNSPIKNIAIRNLDLLKDVVSFKMRFYRCPWARYDLAKLGTLRLIPSEQHIKVLKQDYENMKTMFFAEVPTFLEILDEIRCVEVEYNS
jgi:hypothetical protein